MEESVKLLMLLSFIQTYNLKYKLSTSGHYLDVSYILNRFGMFNSHPPSPVMAKNGSSLLYASSINFGLLRTIIGN